MAKNNNNNSKKKISSVFKKAFSKPSSSASPSRSQVRNSPVPKVSPIAKAAAAAAPVPKVITQEMIAIRAYEISQSPACGSEYDNWIRAERELRGA